MPIRRKTTRSRLDYHLGKSKNEGSVKWDKNFPFSPPKWPSHHKRASKPNNQKCSLSCVYPLCVRGYRQFTLSLLLCLCSHRSDNFVASQVNQHARHISASDIVRLQFETLNSDDTLVITWLIGETLRCAWSFRKTGAEIDLDNVKAFLKAQASFLSKSFLFSSTGTKLLSIINQNGWRFSPQCLRPKIGSLRGGANKPPYWQ